MGQKREIPKKKTPDHLQAELGLSHMLPELGLNPQRLDDERFRVLKISSLNLSAMGAAKSSGKTCQFLITISHPCICWGSPPSWAAQKFPGTWSPCICTGSYPYTDYVVRKPHSSCRWFPSEICSFPTNQIIFTICFLQIVSLHMQK